MLSRLSLVLDTETCTIKGSFVSLRICVFLRSICVHARVIESGTFRLAYILC